MGKNFCISLVVCAGECPHGLARDTAYEGYLGNFVKCWQQLKDDTPLLVRHLTFPQYLLETCQVGRVFVKFFNTCLTLSDQSWKKIAQKRTWVLRWR